MTKYKPLAIDRTYRRIVNLKLEKGLLVESCLLITQYIECFLKDWLLIIGKKEPKGILTTKLKEINYMKLDQLVQIHLFLDNIDNNLYISIHRIKNLRDSFAHNLINIDFSNSSETTKYRKTIEDAIVTCDKVFDKYNDRLTKESTPLMNYRDVTYKDSYVTSNGDLVLK